MIENTYLVINHTFAGVRVFDYTITPVKFKLQIHCGVPDKDSQGSHTTQERASVSFQVLKLWLHNMLDEVTICNPTRDIGDFLLDMSESKIMTTPGEPDDNVLARLLHSKVSVIAKGNLEIVKLILISSDTHNTERHWTGTNYLLPGVEYMEEPTLHKTPWWTRNSIDISDLHKESFTAEEISQLLNDDDMLCEYENTLLEDLAESRESSGEAEIIEDVWTT
jgi:hypothetical protein